MTVGQNTRAYPDTILVISCPVAGFPFPVVVWEKDGKAVTSGDIAVLKDNATTLAYRVGGLDEGGVFTCVAANNAGTVRKASIVNIAGMLKCFFSLIGREYVLEINLLRSGKLKRNSVSINIMNFFFKNLCLLAF